MQDPVETTLDEIENTVRQHPNNSSHRAAHRLKFLLNEIKRHSLTKSQVERYKQLGAISAKNGWRIPKLSE